MKLKIFTFLILQILFFTNIFAQTDDFEIIWEKNYGGNFGEEAYSVIPTLDDCYLIAGYTNSKGVGNSDAWLVKIDKQGNKLWDKTYGEVEDDRALSIVSTSDRGYLIVGLKKEKIWAFKTDANGNILWKQTYGNGNPQGSVNIINSNDGNFMIATEIPANGNWNARLIKINEEGNVLWDKQYGNQNNEIISSIIQTKSQEYILVGHVFSDYEQESEILLIKTDKNGNQIWLKNIKETNNSNVANSIIETDDGFFFIAGYTGYNSQNSLLLKIDNNGNKLWSKTYRKTYSSDFRSIAKLNDKSILMTGNNGTSLWMLKVDNNGEIQWDKTFGYTTGGMRILNNNGNILVLGYKDDDIWLIKIKQKGSILTDNTNPTITLTNPTSTSLTTQNSQITIQGIVTDDTGLKEFKINNNSVSLNGSNFSYSTHLSTGQNIFNLIATDNSGNTTPKQIIITYQPQQTDKIGPDIKITQPDLRGFIVIEQMQYKIKGEVTDPSGVTQVTVNNEPANVDAQGNFSKTITLVYGNNPVTVIATDKYGNQSSKTFNITRDQQNNDNNLITSGKYYALIIGVSEYTNPKIQDLNNEPTNDAKELKRILTTYYTFEEQNITLLLNPTNSEIIRKFDDLNKIITENDNFLIFYAGHGYYDPVDKLGYWLPSNADINYTDNWIYNDVLVANIKKTHSKHTLLISDACFSGSIFKTRDIIQDADMNYQKDYAVKSRNAITSGTLKTVPNKSIFFKYLSEKLINNANPFMSASDLFQQIKKPVSNNSPNIPQFGDIQNVGDEGGDFIFIRKDK